MTTVPFLAAFFGVLLSGWLADKLVKKGFSLGVARKTPIICGLLISTCIMGANYTNDPVWIMTLMAVAFFGNGFASITPVAGVVAGADASDWSDRRRV